MTLYDGRREPPLYGGDWPDKQEVFNFESIGGRLYGYAHPTSQKITLSRIEPEFSSKDRVDDVLVVFFAKRPAIGQVVIGWYRDATVYARARRAQSQRGTRRGHEYYFEAPAETSCLLPPGSRTHPILRQQGVTGYSGITYALDAHGDLRGPWVMRTLEYIRSYRGPNLLRDLTLRTGAEAEVRESEELARLVANGRIGETTKAQLVLARRGQGMFRGQVERNERRCRVTGVCEPEHLRAGHIKPWRYSTNRERLDGENGLLLAPHIDHLFDRGFISFDARGNLLVSPQLDKAVLDTWHIPRGVNVGSFSRGQARYLAFHRREIFLRNRE